MALPVFCNVISELLAKKAFKSREMFEFSTHKILNASSLYFRTAGEGCAGIITKCLNSPRVKTRELGHELLMLYIEAERQETVQDELMKGLTNKQPKVVAGCVVALRNALR